MRSPSLEIRAKVVGLAFGLLSVGALALTIFFSMRSGGGADHAATTLYRASGTMFGATHQGNIAHEVVKEAVDVTSNRSVGLREGSRGALAVEPSEPRVHGDAARVERGAVLGGVVVITLGLVVSWVIAGSFARRIRRIQRATQAFAEGNLREPPIVDDSKDEIGQLSRDFNKMARHIRDLVERIEANGREEAKRLDRIVVARTIELQAKAEELAIILDNAGQGFVTIYPNGRLAEERSAILTKWFGDAPEGVKLWNYLTPFDSDAARWLEVGWEAVFDGMLPLELTLDQLPKEVRRGSSIYGLRYQPVKHEGEVEAIVLVVSDITDEIALRKAEARQRELAGVFGRMVSDPSSVEQFITEATELVPAIQNGTGSRAEQLRSLHTLKGNAAFLGLESISTACHDMETQMIETGEPAPAKLKAHLADLWTELTRVLEPITCGQRDRAIVRVASLRRHIEAIHARAPRRQLAAEVETWLLEPTAVRLERAAAQAANIAARLEKPEPTVVIEDHGLRLDAHTWGPFWSAFVHVVRNAVDHGVEDPDTRLASGKPAAGALALRTFQRGGETVIEIEDDGAGIDWVALRARAGDEASEVELTELLFRDGVSTKSEVSETSGRGVGLSAAHAACKELGGRVDVRTRRGHGTVFSFRVPVAVTERFAAGVAEVAAA